MYPEKTGCEHVDWILLAQDRDWWQAVMKTNVHVGSIKDRKFLD
jgi:hypothetical protein